MIPSPIILFFFCFLTPVLHPWIDLRFFQIFFLVFFSVFFLISLPCLDPSGDPGFSLLLSSFAFQICDPDCVWLVSEIHPLVDDMKTLISKKRQGVLALISRAYWCWCLGVLWSLGALPPSVFSNNHNDYMSGYYIVLRFVFHHSSVACQFFSHFRTDSFHLDSHDFSMV